jgi:hypothetical protein
MTKKQERFHPSDENVLAFTVVAKVRKKTMLRKRCALSPLPAQA